MNNGETKGLIASIQDYSVHDGPGIRSTIFLKGCSLKCRWCQNPESQKETPEILFYPKKCIECYRCLTVCPNEAIISGNKERIDRIKCTNCMKCVEVCPTSALKKVGTWMSVVEIVDFLLCFKPFYDGVVKGGITISGGDPLFQPEFTVELLKKCKEYGIHTAIETSGYANYKIIKKVTDNLDLLLYDIKHMNNELHKKGTGVSNKIILDNIKKLREDNNNLHCVIRIPLIPRFNDDLENIKETAFFINSINVKQVDLLPFNEFPSLKYKELGRGEWVYKSIITQSAEQLNKIKKIVETYGLKVTIGGLW